MKILSMTAMFGRLEQAVLAPGPGLNLICAPNEGGKSTWCAFLKAMLYGVDTRDRDKKGYLADKNRYQPWSGAPMAGELRVQWQGRDITIRRGPRGNTPFGSFSAVYTASGETVPGLTAANCGEMLTGVGREVYERSAFIPSGAAMAVTAAPELEKRIADLVTGGREDVSYAQAEKRLRDMRNRRRVNRSVGRIPELEEELSALTRRLAQAQEISARAVELAARRAALEKGKQALEEEMELHRRLAQGELDARYTRAEEELEGARQRLSDLEREFARFGPQPEERLLLQAQSDLAYLKMLDEEIQRGQEKLEQAEEEYIQAQRALQEGPFMGLSGEQAREQVQRRLNLREESRARAGRRKGLGLAALGLAAGVLAVRLVWPLPLSAAGWLSPGLPALAAALGLLGVWQVLRSRKDAAAAATALDGYGVADEEQLHALAADWEQRCRRAQEAGSSCASARGALNESRARRENRHSDLMDFVHAFAPEVSTLNGCSAALSRALKLGHELELARQQVDERRRRLEDLADQGGKRAARELPCAPQRTPDQTRALLAQTVSRLAGAERDWNQTLGRQKEMGDSALLTARMEQVQEELERQQLEYRAIEMAMQALSRADTRLRERFSPELNRKAGEYLSQLTGGRYDRLTLTRELEGMAARTGEALSRDALYLSRGTMDQLYLAVRLAVSELCLPQHPPVVLDDALANFDDERAALALKMLEQIAAQQQVLLFTCHSRESRLLAGEDGVTCLG